MGHHFNSFLEAAAARYERNQARRAQQVAEIARRATVVPRVAGLGRVGDDVLASVIAEEMARYDQWDAEDRARARSVPPECSHGECSHG